MTEINRDSFTDRYDLEGNLVETAQEAYERFCKNPIVNEPDKIIVLQAELCKMELEMMRLKG